MGEHGDSEFAVWSHTNIGGLPIYEWVRSNSRVDELALLNTFEKTKNAAYEIIKKKRCYLLWNWNGSCKNS